MSEPMPPVPAGVIAYLSVAGADRAIAFYEAGLGARELLRQMAPDGKRVMHARLIINDGLVMLSDDFPEYNDGQSQAPPPGPRGIVLHLQVGDCDAAFAQATAAGAGVVLAPRDMFWGDRYAQVRDPFGHVWSIGAPIRHSDP